MNPAGGQSINTMIRLSRCWTSKYEANPSESFHGQCHHVGPSRGHRVWYERMCRGWYTFFMRLEPAPSVNHHLLRDHRPISLATQGSGSEVVSSFRFPMLKRTSNHAYSFFSVLDIIRNTRREQTSSPKTTRSRRVRSRWHFCRCRDNDLRSNAGLLQRLHT